MKKNIQLTFAAVVALMAAGVCASADAPSATENPVAVAQTPAEQLDELEQIWVRGKHLSEVIEDAEDDFFKLYNKLNKDSSYDVFCGQMALNSGSMIMVRKCSPGFVVFSGYDPLSNSVSIGSDYGSCSGSVTYWDTTGDPYFMSSCSTSYSSYGYVSNNSSSSRTSSALMLMDRRPAYLKNVLEVVSSDSRLLEKVKNLAGLYGEMDVAQQQYVKLKDGAKIDRVNWKTPKPNRGPRAL